MATAEKIKIAELQIDAKDILETQAELRDRIRETTQATAQLEAQQKSLRAEGQASSEAYKENAKQIELNKTVIGGLTREYKDNTAVLASMATANTESAGTLEKLTARNKELRTMLKGLNLETEEGRKRQKEYIAEIDKNTKFIKDNSDAYVQQKMTIGDYKSVLEGLPPSLQAGASGFQKMTAAAKAFLLNPIALAITAIVGAVTALFKAFRSTEEGGDRLRKVFDQIKAAVSVVTDRIENFALGLVKVFSGEKKLRDLKGTFADMGDEIRRDVELAGQLRDMMEQLQDAEIDLTVTSAERRAEIKKLQEAAADQNKTDAERITLMQRAQRLMTEEADAQQKILLTKIANELGTTDLEYAQMRLNSVREKGLQITLNEIGLNNSTNEDRKRVNDLIAQYIQLEEQASSQKKETTSQISGLVKKERTEREQQLAEENEVIKTFYENQLRMAEEEMLAEIELEKRKAAEKERIRQEEIAKQQQWDEDLRAFRQEKALIDAENERIARELQMNDRFQAELDILAKEQEAEIQAALKTGANVSLIMRKYSLIEQQIAKEKEKAKLDITASFAGAISDLLGRETAAGKAAAIVQTVINTWKGAMSAFAETPGGIIIKSAAAVTAVGTGIAAIRNIMKAGGGSAGASAGLSPDLGSIAGASVRPDNSPLYSSFIPSGIPTQPQTVLVIEDFQKVQQQQIAVKRAAEL